MDILVPIINPTTSPSHIALENQAVGGYILYNVSIDYLCGLTKKPKTIEKEMTIEQIWQYGKELGSKFYSPYISDVDYFEDNRSKRPGIGVICSKVKSKALMSAKISINENNSFDSSKLFPL